MAEMTDIPVCPSCLHPHLPEVRCPICGHKGKGNSFRLPKFKGASQSLHFVPFDSTQTSVRWSDHVSCWTAMSNIALLLRRDIFLAEFHVSEGDEFDAHDSALTTRHVLGFVGDAPVGYARWRLDILGGSHVALVDRLCVKESHRHRGIAKEAIQFMMEDASKVARENSLQLAGVVLNVPADATALRAKLIENGFAQIGDDSAVFIERGRPHVHYAVGLPTATSSVAVTLPSTPMSPVSSGGAAAAAAAAGGCSSGVESPSLGVWGRPPPPPPSQQEGSHP